MAQETVRRLYYGTLQESKDEIEARLDEALKPFRKGQEDYSSAALDYVRELERRQNAATALAIDDDD